MMSVLLESQFGDLHVHRRYVVVAAAADAPHIVAGQPHTADPPHTVAAVETETAVVVADVLLRQKTAVHHVYVHAHVHVHIQTAAAETAAAAVAVENARLLPRPRQLQLQPLRIASRHTRAHVRVRVRKRRTPAAGAVADDAGTGIVRVRWTVVWVMLRVLLHLLRMVRLKRMYDDGIGIAFRRTGAAVVVVVAVAVVAAYSR